MAWARSPGKDPSTERPIQFTIRPYGSQRGGTRVGADAEPGRGVPRVESAGAAAAALGHALHRRRPHRAGDRLGRPAGWKAGARAVLVRDAAALALPLHPRRRGAAARRLQQRRAARLARLLYLAA